MRRTLLVYAALAIGSATTAIAQIRQLSAFDRLDSNGDGFVDCDELAKSQFGKNNPGLFDQLDTNKDGKVSRAESQRATGGNSAPTTAPTKDGAMQTMPPPERPGEPDLSPSKQSTVCHRLAEDQGGLERWFASVIRRRRS
jgi:hypothetical protein